MSEATNVLLVDDDEVDAMVVKRAFRKRGIANAITVAKNGVDALQLLRDGSVPDPYLILLDLNMPRMNGLQFLEELRADPALAPAPVFVLSTSRAASDRSQALALEALAYISKCRFAEEFWPELDRCEQFLAARPEQPGPRKEAI